MQAAKGGGGAQRTGRCIGEFPQQRRSLAFDSIQLEHPPCLACRSLGSYYMWKVEVPRAGSKKKQKGKKA